METKDIDLMKYNNLQFKAVIGGSISTGTIIKDRGILLSLTTMTSRHYVSYENLLRLIDGGNITHCETIISDFEIIPRDPETYEDWRVGDKVYNPNVKYTQEKEVIFRSGELVVCKDVIGDISGVYTCGELCRLGYRLVLTDIEKQIIEERKKPEWEPQDGDICYAETKSGAQKFIIIYNHQDWSLEYGVKSGKWRLVEDFSWLYSTIRPATEDEKQKLFDAMSKQGKRWNAEKKVMEDIPKPYEFRKGEPVLVRNFHNQKWRISTFLDIMTNGAYMTRDCSAAVYCGICIPYNERTMHLLGTSEDYKEGE